ncbi:hypothetical protein TSH7_17555 [Azospirillum sp. TSH7]|uniref:cadherin-like domain-containing protein n=1 Tax=unclassified Azospirillum TaxID=2630922 RepID=UPI000D60E1C7|nr:MULTISPECIES: cadherin-like domain-containing protein [unclassified Azospirillum]PWC61044.1 hypothetical protein TSH7_17555 [Azospirillum sp. TSH7]PWC62818.1 hypothetical protein TSH20_21210 [Azospirillum sp. TSH20]
MAAQTSVKVAVQTGAAKDDAFSQGQVTEDSRIASLNVLANDPGSARIWSLYQEQTTLNLASGANTVTLTSGATISINADGTIKYDASGITATNLDALDDGDTFEDSFTYTVRMANGALSTAKATVVIQGKNDAPVLSGAPAALAAGTEDAAYTFSAADLLQGYSDVDGDVLSVTNLTASHGTVTDNGNGTWTFNPDANYNGAVSLSYGVTDGAVTVDALQGFDLDAVKDEYAFGFTVTRSTSTISSTTTLTYSGAPPTDQNAFSQQYGDWVRSLASLGQDLNGDGAVSTAWHQNSQTNTITVEGSDLTFSSTAYTVGTGNGAKTRYYVSDLTATSSISASSTLDVAATDNTAFVINNFQPGSDTLAFTGLDSLSSAEFNTAFSMIEADVTGDGIVDTTIKLAGSSWSVTLAGVHDVGLSSLFAV